MSVMNQRGQVFLTEVTASTFQESMVNSYRTAIYTKPGQELQKLRQCLILLSSPLK